MIIVRIFRVGFQCAIPACLLIIVLFYRFGGAANKPAPRANFQIALVDQIRKLCVFASPIPYITPIRHQVVAHTSGYYLMNIIAIQSKG